MGSTASSETDGSRRLSCEDGGPGVGRLVNGRKLSCFVVAVSLQHHYLGTAACAKSYRFGECSPRSSERASTEGWPRPGRGPSLGSPQCRHSAEDLTCCREALRVAACTVTARVLSETHASAATVG